MSKAADLYERMRDYLSERDPVTFMPVEPPRTNSETAKASQTSHARARVSTQHASDPLSLSLFSSASRARVTFGTVLRPAVVIALADRPRWSDQSSALFWLRQRGWRALAVSGVVIEGEAPWRRWVRRAGAGELLALRDRVADAGPLAPESASHTP